MDSNIENKFVKNFITKNIQERLIFELNGKRRKDGIGRFCHRTEEMIKMEKVIASGNKLYKEEILKTINNYDIKGKWYVISFYDEFDGNFYELEEALKNVLSLGMASIIISDEIAIIETEQCYGTPERYILHI